MSLEAMAWVLNDAPGLPANAFGTLMGLANHADHQGRGAFIAQATLGRYARKTDRQVRRDLAELEELGLIRRGNQALVNHLPPMKRPIVWDLALDLRETGDSDRTPTTGHGSPAGRVRPVVDDRPDTYDRSYTAARPDVDVLQTVIEPTTPTAEVRSRSVGARKRADTPSRGTRIPDDFHLTPEMIEWGKKKFPTLDGDSQTEAFVDYWKSVPGAKGLKVDWVATWRTWIRRAAERPQQPTNGIVRAASTAPRPSTTDQRIAELRAAGERVKAQIYGNTA